jgi:NAD-dependent SIR2 family protein deacetylase
VADRFDAAPLTSAVADGDVVTLTGAGISTESGIPDYRGPTGARRRTTPMTYQTFVADPIARRRYWARSHLGWRTIAAARPNAGHVAVTRLQQAGVVTGLITQNVDGLHQAAGSTELVELHGGLDRVVCLGCGVRELRHHLAARLRAVNSGFDAELRGVNPDGDAELADADLDRFVMVACTCCGSDLLKPDVVFFGENVPKDRVVRCFDMVERAALLLVLGSSLTVMSGFRFARRAAALGIPVAIVNQGPTRADDLAEIRLDAPLGVALPALAAAICGTEFFSG